MRSANDKETEIPCFCQHPNQACSAPKCKNRRNRKGEFKGDFRDYFNLKDQNGQEREQA